MSKSSDRAAVRDGHARQPDVIKRIHDEFRLRLRDYAARRETAPNPALKTA